MNNLLKLLSLTALALLSSASFAHENPDQTGTCYIFKNNQLKAKQSCVIKTGGGAGGMYTILQIGQNFYRFETSTMSEDYPTVYYETDSKTKEVVEYSRNSKTLRILSNQQMDKAKDPLWCYKTKDNRLDICSN